jgi:hypothetical protein
MQLFKKQDKLTVIIMALFGATVFSSSHADSTCQGSCAAWGYWRCVPEPAYSYCFNDMTDWWNCLDTADQISQCGFDGGYWQPTQPFSPDSAWFDNNLQTFILYAYWTATDIAGPPATWFAPDPNNPGHFIPMPPNQSPNGGVLELPGNTCGVLSILGSDLCY